MAGDHKIAGLKASKIIMVASGVVILAVISLVVLLSQDQHSHSPPRKIEIDDAHQLF